MLFSKTSPTKIEAPGGGNRKLVAQKTGGFDHDVVALRFADRCDQADELHVVIQTNFYRARGANGWTRRVIRHIQAIVDGLHPCCWHTGDLQPSIHRLGDRDETIAELGEKKDQLGVGRAGLENGMVVDANIGDAGQSGRRACVGEGTEGIADDEVGRETSG